ncbi:hypothetical protein HanLR1_Chr13g0506511 [Helianthus annuus]|nr:hypothetical protein HanHA89_Chr13g0536601 [Helianthus annuus]KAJ0665683.1 hypothetical protein HanLR1_Chr13g0506511 [Helianthus annuus]
MSLPVIFKHEEHSVTGLLFDPVWRPQVPGYKPIHPASLCGSLVSSLPWTHQESGANSRPVVRSSFARLGTYTSSLTLTPSPDKVQD